MIAAGSGVATMYNEPIVARLQYISGGQFWADYIHLRSLIGTDSQSWGTIKELFR